ncbi:hypothetical protein [Actinacidiphila glaucinigra]|uniref:hypothetical protein n=1 Tax=Actinacidiphila glaucinigra TaxID=235986 RepID=UPI00368AB34C
MVTHRTTPGKAPVATVSGLRDDWSQARTGPARPGPRAHEILETTVQFELTGRTGFGSGGGLGTARANPGGTREGDREPDPAQHPHDAAGSDGERIPPPPLSRAQWQQVDAALDELAGRLASVTPLCEPGRTV